MPEGPEVRVTRDILRKYLKVINNIIVHDFKFPKIPLPAKVDSVESKGKLLYIKIGDMYLVNHMMLTGRWTTKKSSANRITFMTSNGKIYYNDSRKFGKFEWLDEQDMSKKLDNIGPDILAGELTLNKFKAILSGRRGRIISIINNQKLIGGIGNYLRSEIMHESGLPLLIKANEITDNQVKKLYDAILKVTTKFYIGGGSAKYSGDGVEFKVYGKRNKIKIGNQYIWTIRNEQ